MASPELGVVGLSVLRLAVAAIVLLAAAPVFGVRPPAWRDLPLILACGLTGMTGYQLLLNQGELSVPAGTASILVASAPLVSAGIAAVTLGERLTPARLVGSGVAVTGVALVCLSRSGLGLSGDVWVVVGAAVVQGIYHPLTRPLLRTYIGLEVATYAMVSERRRLGGRDLPRSPALSTGLRALGLTPEVVPGLVELEVAVPHLSPAVR